MENELSRTLSVAGAKVQYDTMVKRVLSNKIILAWILRSIIKEYEDMSLEEVKSYIEGEPQVGEIPVNPGETNGERITGTNTEDAVPNEGKVTYDIRFHTYLPGKKEKVKLIVNVEAQKNFYTGYHMETRGIFYCSRMISAQLGTEFEEPHYDDIKKVYSIWICMNAPKYIGNGISEYSFQKHDVVEGIPDNKEAYDKQSVVMICLNENQKSGNTLQKMLNVLLSQKLEVEEKKRILQKEYGISMEKSMEQEVHGMCNLSDWVYDQGVEDGMEKGKNLGIRTMVVNMLKDGSFSDEKIILISGISEESLNDIKNENAHCFV